MRRGRVAVVALAVAVLSCAPAACALAGAPEPRIRHDARLPLGRPDPGEIVNRNDSPRITDPVAWEAFWRDVAPRLEAWSADPRIDLNPNFVAAILAKESGFEPLATSWTPALGIAQITQVADNDMRQIVAEAEGWRWMHAEVKHWPRDRRARTHDITKPQLDSLLAAGSVHPGTEYLFDPQSGTRAALFWLRLLVEAWTGDEWPGAHGSFARARLNRGEPLTEAQLVDLVSVSYNQGHPYVRSLVELHGSAWDRHLNDEAADYLDRIRRYTVIFQQSGR